MAFFKGVFVGSKRRGLALEEEAIRLGSNLAHLTQVTAIDGHGMKRREDKDDAADHPFPRPFKTRIHHKRPPSASSHSEDAMEELEPRMQRRGKNVDRSVLASESSSSDDSESETIAERKRVLRQKDDSDEYEEPDATHEDIRSIDPDDLDRSRKHRRLDLGNIPNQEFIPSLVEEKDAVEGTKIEPFNMEADLEEGDFDEQGTFVWKSKEALDPMRHHDVWLEGVEDVEVIRKAREAKEKQERVMKEREEKDRVAFGSDKHALEACRLELAGLMLEDGSETVQQTLKRLGDEVRESGAGSVVKSSWAQRQQMRKEKMKVKAGGASTKRKLPGAFDGEEEERLSGNGEMPVPSTVQVREKADRMTDLAHRLLEAGMTDVYRMTRRQLMLYSP